MSKKSPLFLVLLLCPVVFAQSTFSGPGVISRASSGIGQRSGKDVDLRYFVNALGVYDTGLTPYAINPDGSLVKTGTLPGIELGLGAYGKHTFRRDVLGLDYYGNFRHYPSSANYDGSNQAFNFEYTHQQSQRLIFDYTASAGTQSYGTVFGFGGNPAGAVVSGTGVLFDNRTSYLQTSLNARYATSGRTTIDVGGNFYAIDRQSSALVSVRGYTLQGAITHRMNRNSFIGANFQHVHYDYARAFGEADINTYTGTYSAKLGRSVDIVLAGGVFVSEVQGTTSTPLDPSVAALFGVSSLETSFYQKNLLPMVSATLTKQFRRASISGYYSRSVSNGNGVYLTSKQEQMSGSYSYTGTRYWSAGISVGTTTLGSLGQLLVPYRQIYGTANVNYNLGKNFHLSAAYYRRVQDITNSAFPPRSSRISLGIYYSPGTIPISFH